MSVSAFLVGCDENGNENTAESKDSNVSSFVIVSSNGKKLMLGDSEAQMKNAFGEPNSKEEAGTCGKQGTLFRYTYSSVTVEILSSEKESTVDYIAVNDDLVSTDKGVRIGTSRDEVIKQYGEPSADDGNNIRYNEGSFILKFGIENDKVSSLTLIRNTQE